MRRQHIERYEIGDDGLLFFGVRSIDDIRINYSFSGHEVMLDFFIGVVEFHFVFSKLFQTYSSPLLISFVTPAISFFTIALTGSVGSSGTLYNFFTIGRV